MMHRLSKFIQKVQVIRPNFLSVVQWQKLCSTMDNSGSRREHDEITANQTRQQDIHQTVVSDTKQLSESVKELTLKVEDQNLSFKAGQWVDFFIPGMQTFTGYTMTSAPHELTNSNKLKLAIKYSSYAPTLWVHEKCKIGSNVAIRIGGDFYFPNSDEDDVDLLLIGGGVGINPLISILGQFFDDKDRQFHGSASLLFSAQTENGLIYKEKIEKWHEHFPHRFHHQLFVTRDSGVANSKILGTRMTAEHLKASLGKLRLDKVLSYICGPLEMIDDTSKALSNLGLPNSRILYEKWW